MLGSGPIAVGRSSQHPVPGCPLVDDSILQLGPEFSLEDAQRIEAIGRRRGGGSWGRYDSMGGGFVAMTTVPGTTRAFLVVNSPKFGTSVEMYASWDDAVLVQSHSAMRWRPVLTRCGTYVYDGESWMSAVSEEGRLVPGARTLSAEDLAGDATIRDWMKLGHDASRAVASVIAPELHPSQLVGYADVASVMGRSEASVRALVARGEGDSLPARQMSNGTRPLWARAVIEDHLGLDDGVALCDVIGTPLDNFVEFFKVAPGTWKQDEVVIATDVSRAEATQIVSELRAAIEDEGFEVSGPGPLGYSVLGEPQVEEQHAGLYGEVHLSPWRPGSVRWPMPEVEMR